MDVTITEISPETVNALRSLAHKNGKTLDEYARSILEREAQINSETEEFQNSIKKDLAEFEKNELKHLEEEFEGYEQLYPRR